MDNAARAHGAAMTAGSRFVALCAGLVHFHESAARRHAVEFNSFPHEARGAASSARARREDGPGPSDAAAWPFVGGAAGQIQD